MIAFYRDYRCDESTEPVWHAGFLAMLPQIREQLRYGFRRLPADERAEAMADAIAGIAIAYARLYQQGKAAVAFPSVLAKYTVRQYFAGRRVGSELNADDVTSRHSQRQRGFHVESLDRRDPSGAWKEVVVEDRRSTPADTAASRIDLDDWFGQLPRLKCGIAQTLATGETTKETARQFAVTPGRVLQLRPSRSWPAMLSFDLDNWVAASDRPLVRSLRLVIGGGPSKVLKTVQCTVLLEFLGRTAERRQGSISSDFGETCKKWAILDSNQ
jgi:hypothetical protein